MKTTLELSGNLLRQAQEEADRNGQALGVFVEDAIEARLGIHAARAIKPWQKHFGSLRHLHEESARIGAGEWARRAKGIAPPQNGETADDARFASLQKKFPAAVR